MGFDLWNGNPNYASLPLRGTAGIGKREGREYTKPFQLLSSLPFIPEKRSEGKSKVGKENELLNMFQYLDYYFGWMATMKLLDESHNLFYGGSEVCCKALVCMKSPRKWRETKPQPS